MKVRDCMSREVRIAKLEDTLQSAARTMAEIDAGFLPVEHRERLVGIVTDRDIAIRGTGSGCHPDTPVEEVMSHEVKYCFDDQDSSDVLQNMSEIQVRRLPVVDRDKKLVGVVSISDLAADETYAAGSALEAISRPCLQHSQLL